MGPHDNQKWTNDNDFRFGKARNQIDGGTYFEPSLELMNIFDNVSYSEEFTSCCIVSVHWFHSVPGTFQMPGPVHMVIFNC